ncbi:MAG TPA: alpha-L-arabinofuranosidase C-terminal domain-containing protein, partial [Vicinamibacteria bacterium]|nr:alpha-L-arabinofuranosidase C-terminal domain-containing protein [Vicinamibacteria bacterium]
KGQSLTLTVVNPHVSEAREAEIAVRGGAVASVRATTLTADDIHAHNSFDRPRAVEPKESAASPPRDGVVVHRFAPASVSRLTMDLR